MANLPKSPSFFPTATSPEQRSLDFFRHCTSVEIAGCMISELWSTSVLQIASCQPAIRHAVIAIGALHEDFQLHPRAPYPDFAIQQYSKAIQSLFILFLTDSNEAADVTLLSCILFAAFESLRSHYKSAQTHISSGLKMVSAQEVAHGYARAKHPFWALLLPLFVFLDTQTMEVGDKLSLPPTEQMFAYPKVLALPMAFSSFEEAQTSLWSYRNHVLHFLERYEGMKDPNMLAEDAENLHEERAALAKHFGQWCSLFDQACFPQSHPAVLILQMQRTVIELIAELRVAPGEMMWDGSHAYFSRIVTLGETFMLNYNRSTETTPVLPNFVGLTPTLEDTLNNHSDQRHNELYARYRSDKSRSPSDDTGLDTETASTTPSSSSIPQTQKDFVKPTFTLSHGIVSPLAMVCARCRDPVIRRRALRILQTCNRKEGIWDSATSARVAERIIQIEETGAGVVVTDASQIPQRARIKHLETFFGPGKRRDIRYTMSAATVPIKVIEQLHDGIGQLDEPEDEVQRRSFFSTKFVNLRRESVMSK